MSGSNQEVSMSRIYSELLKMEQIYSDNRAIKIHVNGTQIIIKHDDEVYKSEIIIDFSEREFFGYLNMPKEIFDTLKSLPNNQDERFVMVKIILDEDNFKLILGADEIVVNYQSNIEFKKDDFLDLLEEMNLDQILNENKNLMDDIDKEEK